MCIRDRYLGTLAWLAIILVAQSALGQLQIPNQPGKTFPLDPAQEIAKQANGLPTIKFEHDGKNFYGSPIGRSDTTLALLRWDGRVSSLPANDQSKIEVIDRNFLPYTHEELKERLQKEFGRRYTVSTTKHYVVVHPPGAAKIWAEPFEELHQSFVYWLSLIHI